MGKDDIEHLLGMFWNDVRLKRYVEIRQGDSIPLAPALGYVALIKGIFYSDTNLDLLEAIFGVGADGVWHQAEADVEDAIAVIVKDGWDAVVYGRSVSAWADLLMQLAPDGLGTEVDYLEALKDFRGLYRHAVYRPSTHSDQIGRWRRGLHIVQTRGTCPQGRPRRRRRRQGRRYRPRGRQLHLFAHRLSLQASLQGREGDARPAASACTAPTAPTWSSRFPCGTVVRACSTSTMQPVEQIADLTRNGERVVVAKGGRGGRGNTHFVTPTRRAPAFSELGEPTEPLWIELEMKLMADAALVGMPSVGKSSLIACMSRRASQDRRLPVHDAACPTWAWCARATT